jgi:hypothetical protein
MSNSESIIQFGNNAYGKPATGLNILREVIMGRNYLTMLLRYMQTVGNSNILLRKTFLEQWKTPLRLILTGSLEVVLFY